MQTTVNELLQTLLTKAKFAQTRAHAPYSNFQVGVALTDNQQLTHTGCNVENAAYPLGQCAEATAIGSMVVNGGKRIRDILIVSPTADFCPPCGGCRQKIAEFADRDTMVHLATNQGELTSIKFTELLPMAFGLAE